MQLRKFVRLFDIKTTKFILVGIVNTLIGSVIMFGLYNVFHVSYWLSSAGNYVIGSIFSYILNKNWTFSHKGDSLKTVLWFVLNIIVCYILAYGIAKPVTGFLLENAGRTIQDNVSMGIGLVLFTGFNYLGQRYLVFRESQPENQ